MQEGSLPFICYSIRNPPQSSAASLFSPEAAIREILPDWQCQAALAFCRGLLRTEKTPTLSAIATAAGIVMAPLSELFNDEFAWWEPAELWRHQWQGLEPGGSLCFDDTVIPKEHTRATEATHPIFSGCAKRVLQGQTFLAALYVQPSGGVRLLWMGLWRPDGPNKRVLAQKLLEQLLEAGIAPDDVSFDGWYAETELLSWLSGRGLIWTTRIRKCRKFFFPGGVETTSQNWAKGVPIASWHYYRERGAYAKAVEIASHSILPAKLVVVRRGRTEKNESEWFYMLTNDRTAGVRRVMARYRRRWGIEVAFRTCKQVLGLDVYRHLTAIGAERHVALVGFLFNYLATWQARSGLTIGRLKRCVANTERTEVHGRPPLEMAS